MGKRKLIVGISAIMLLASIWIAGVMDTGTEKQQISKKPNFSETKVSKEAVLNELKGASDSGYNIKLNKITDVTIAADLGTDDPNDKIISVFYTFDSWNEKDTVKKSIATSVEIFKRLFANKSISRVGTFSQQEFIDSKGNTKTSVAVKLILDRDEIEGVNWGGIKERVLLNYNSIFDLVSTYTVHPSLQKYIGQ